MSSDSLFGDLHTFGVTIYRCCRDGTKVRSASKFAEYCP